MDSVGSFKPHDTMRQEPQMMLPKMITSPLPPGMILSIWRGRCQGPQQQSELSGWSCKRG